MDNLKKYCNTNKLIYLTKIDREIGDFMLKQVPKVLKLYPENTNIYHKRALDILEIFYKPPPIGEETYCKKLFGLINVGESCYLDSVLFALFAIPNEFVDSNILYSDLKVNKNKFYMCTKSFEISSKQGEIDMNNRKKVQNSLREIAESIRGSKKVEYCTDLRLVLKRCPSVDNFYETGMKDPAEFLIYLLRMFDVDKVVKEEIVYYTNYKGNIYNLDIDETNPELKVMKRSIKKDESIIQYIDKTYLNNLNKNEVYYISKFLTTIDAEIENLIYTKKIYYSPYIVFYCERISFDILEYNRMILSGDVDLEKLSIKLNKIKIIPSKTITIESGDRFQLSSIVVWKDYHYTCYFKCGHTWYYYNDLNNNIKTIGTYQQMLRSNASPVSNGILYYYVSM